MSLSRRGFLAASSGSVAFGLGLPALFRGAALAAPGADRPGAKSTILVVVQLTGGNDGLNTVIPWRDPEYAKARPTLKQAANKVRKIDDDVAFHPSLEGFSKLLERSRLAVLQGVGYPKPNRSHFASMDVWHKATPAKDETFGWLGRALPSLGNDRMAAYVGGEDVPLALVGSTGQALSLRSLDEYRLKTARVGDDPAKRSVIEGFAGKSPSASSSGNDLLDLVRRSARDTYRSTAQLQAALQAYRPAVAYPNTGLAGRLKLIAQLVDAGVPERVYYTQLGGFDTHAAQAATHGDLLKELGDGLAAFEADLSEHGHGGRTLTMSFSEFGRRVRENGSQGTDHGAAAAMFVAGEAVRTGVHGPHPSLTDLDSGDLKHHTDFRSVYATLLEGWLGIDPGLVLDQDYPRIELLKKQA